VGKSREGKRKEEVTLNSEEKKIEEKKKTLSLRVVC